MRDLSIYIHIPFCVRKCLYCDFLSFPVSGQVSGQARQCRPGEQDCDGSYDFAKIPDMQRQRMKNYVNLLKKEIKESSVLYREHRVISIFWGGGTPSLLPAADICDIMETLSTYYHIAQDAETTMEMNPGTVDADKLKHYITAGINRVSIGLQSTDDRELQRIGRIHDYGTFRKTYELVRRTGFGNVNIDLMAALPGQSMASYERTLGRITALRPEHISAYSLILEEGTFLYEQQAQYDFPTEDEDRDMYLLTRDYLASCGYHRYEISNYALEGYECRHNKVYWQRGDYVGFGLGASSMVQNARWSNPAEFGTYQACVEQRLQDGAGPEKHGIAPWEEGELPDRQRLTLQEQMEEYMFLGLRMMCGVGRRRFEQQFGQRIEAVYGDILGNLYKQGLLVCDRDYIRLTDRGIDVSNYVMAQFLFP